ncbi:MAG: ABC transporter ATP-binding protein [Cyclobacteriaceae bacterium]|nr:ABC transporter ATP-binding protein [Cyclobacteriaceae bacterium]
MLQASNIKKSYGELQVLKGINLFIEKSEVISIVGASGAGKSTLLHILGTLDNPDSGDILLNGKNPFSMGNAEVARFRNTHIGFIFQFHNLLPEFNALENICMPAFIAGISNKEAEKRAFKLMELLGIKDRAGNKPSEMSGGEQQRTAVARALINNPEIILADEPSGNLDSKNANELHELFFNLRKELGQTIVVVTHNEHLAQMADRTLEMKDGLIVN